MSMNKDSFIQKKLFGPFLAESLGGRINNLNLLRFIAATVVLVSHSFVLVIGNEYADPIKAMTGFSMGQYAVAVFFCVSGLLIAKSFDQRKSMGRFIASRILRLWPALLLSLFLSAFVLGGIITNISKIEYFANVGTLQYVPSNAILARPVYELPGVFSKNPGGPTVNGSLWSLFYEVSCYATLVVLGLLGIFSSKKIASLVLFLSIVGHVFSIFWQPEDGLAYRFDTFLFWWLLFFVGFASYLFRDALRVGYIGLVLLSFFVVISYRSEFFITSICMFLSYAALFFAFSIKGKLLLYNNFGDYSYGIYVFSFPIQQSLVNFFPGASVFSNVAYSFVITIIISIFSWKFVEKKALAFSDVWGERINRIIERFRTFKDVLR